MDNLLGKCDRKHTDDRRAYPSCPEQHSDDPRAGHVDPYGGGDYRA